jgi:hypothetical protein
MHIYKRLLLILRLYCAAIMLLIAFGRPGGQLGQRAADGSPIMGP